MPIQLTNISLSILSLFAQGAGSKALECGTEVYIWGYRAVAILSSADGHDGAKMSLISLPGAIRHGTKVIGDEGRVEGGEGVCGLPQL